MDVRFEDHAQFNRAAALAAMGGGALVAVAPHGFLAPAAVAGSALAVAFAQPNRRKTAAAAACVLFAVGSLAEPRLLLACGAMLAVVFALGRAEAPPKWAVALSAALGAGAAALAGGVLGPLAS